MNSEITPGMHRTTRTRTPTTNQGIVVAKGAKTFDARLAMSILSIHRNNITTDTEIKPKATIPMNTLHRNEMERHIAFQRRLIHCRIVNAAKDLTELWLNADFELPSVWTGCVLEETPSFMSLSFLCLRMAERDMSKKGPLSMSLTWAPGKRPFGKHGKRSARTRVPSCIVSFQ